MTTGLVSFTGMNPMARPQKCTGQHSLVNGHVHIAHEIDTATHVSRHSEQQQAVAKFMVVNAFYQKESVNGVTHCGWGG